MASSTASLYLAALRSLAASATHFVTDVSAINGPQDRRYLLALIEAWERIDDTRRHEQARLSAENRVLSLALHDALEETAIATRRAARAVAERDAALGMDREGGVAMDHLLHQLVALSEQTQTCHRVAVRAGREDLATELEFLGAKVAVLIARATRDAVAQEQA